MSHLDQRVVAVESDAFQSEGGSVGFQYRPVTPCSGRSFVSGGNQRLARVCGLLVVWYSIEDDCSRTLKLPVEHKQNNSTLWPLARPK